MFLLSHEIFFINIFHNIFAQCKNHNSFFSQISSDQQSARAAGAELVNSLPEQYFLRHRSPSGDLMAATPAVSRTEPELREAILEQTARVRKLKVKPEIEEATRELVSLKEEYKTVTGGEWSDLREEGPILLTTNKVRGREVLPELKGMVKQLRRENIIRQVKNLFKMEF